MFRIKNELNKLILLSHKYRKFILIIIDSLCIILSIYFALLFSEDKIVSNNLFYSFIIIILLSIPIYYLTGQYKGLSRYLGSSELYKIVGRNSLLILILIFSASIFCYKNIFTFYSSLLDNS